MHIIPVIDLLDGQVVHAKFGQRHTYQPISSKLTPSSNPVDIVKAFLDIHPFQTLYIADLNALQPNRADFQHTEIINTLSTQFPNLSIWLDAGINHCTEMNQRINPKIIPILGTESFDSIEQYLSLSQQLHDFVLSIDINQEGFMGPGRLLETPNDWPNNVIIMSLTKVGSNHGVDIRTLMQMKQIAPMKNFYAAGGIRHISDIQALAASNIKGALIATALHSMQITSQDLSHLRT